MSGAPALLPWSGLGGFEHPLIGLGLAVLALALLAASFRRHLPSVAWPALAEIRAAGGRRRDPGLILARALRLGALFALAAVLAGPLALHARARPPSEGLDVVLVLDTSTSMRALDAEVEGDWWTRLDLAREVVRRFALHRVSDGDRVGLVVFGESAFTHCPLTSDGGLLGAALERVHAGMAGEATALGDALALAVKRATPGQDDTLGAPVAGRLVVLLTDGRSNAGAVPPDVAAALARARGVRVHTVGIGSEGEVPMAGSEGGAGRGLRFERHDLDRATLERVARATGGRFFEARSPADLEFVYAEIDALERVPRRTDDVPVDVEPRPAPLLALAGVLGLGELLTTRVLRRRLP